MSLKPQSIRIGNLQEADVDSVFSILEQVYQKSIYPVGGAWNRRLLELQIQNDPSLGLWKNKKLCSFLFYREMDSIWEITLLATDLSEQEKGYMSALLKHFLQTLPKGNQIWLEVHELNLLAQKLYTKFGFRKSGVRPKYYRDGNNAILFTYKTLS
ncbi:MAG: GNAT family N-acetyltransferase [Bdellovibrionales bacterium]|nr:GNAT family N-acetyltransferase [Bdellovibrionales bacterium]